jgi:hypothetical protein
LDKENTWRNKKNEKRINPLKDFEKAKERIKEYHLKLKFYDNIEFIHHSNMILIEFMIMI